MVYVCVCGRRRDGQVNVRWGINSQAILTGQRRRWMGDDDDEEEDGSVELTNQPCKPVALVVPIRLPLDRPYNFLCYSDRNQGTGDRQRRFAEACGIAKFQPPAFVDLEAPLVSQQPATSPCRSTGPVFAVVGLPLRLRPGAWTCWATKRSPTMQGSRPYLLTMQ